jgi:methionyl-tRNA formyltransferase
MTRIVFFGTADLARPSLSALARQPEFSLLTAVTQPDRPKGRELKLQPPPVKREAQAHELPVLQPERARHPEFVEQLAQLKPDLIVVAAYGQILPKSILDLPARGCLNVHASLLPKYRGAAPIQWAILNDEAETGVTIMKMDAGLDTGDILTQQSIPIRPSDTAQSLHDQLASLGAELLVRTIPDYLAGKILPRPQPLEGIIYARKITKQDGQLDWTASAHTLWNRIRAFNPWPGAYTFLPGETRQPLLKIWEAEPLPSPAAPAGQVISADKSGIVTGCGEGTLRILNLQREGSRRMNAQEFLAGHPLSPGTKLGLV